MNDTDNFILDTQLDPRYGIYDSYPSDRPEQQQQWNGTPRSERTPLRGILRNSASRPSCGSEGYIAQSYGAQGSPRCYSADAVLRACTAEVISVLIAVFISEHVRAAIVEYHLSFLQRIAFLSFVDATVVLVFVSAFRTVHISPVVSLAQMFAMTTSWIMCLLLFLMQIVASITAVFLYNYLREIPADSIATINQNVKTDWLKSTYTLVILQFCGTTMVVMSNLMITSRQGARHTYVGFMSSSPLCLFASILISSFLSLSQSTVHWNPLQSLATSVFFSVKGGHSPWNSHYVFWIGPLGGSMFACFLYRLFFAPEDKRLTNCCCASEPPQPV
uniref:G_PROTEIN_RECEP_F1_2 domain-containing protein n=1 Tax=Steinernema glaseri TaxID=37863 RepID=A0A1I7ZIV5_9BILA